MNWFNKLKEIHDRGDQLRKQAEQVAAKLGHKLDAWTSLQNCVCRRCGAYAKINNVFAKSDVPDFYGAAFKNPCSVRFENDDTYKWQEFTNPWPKNAVV